MKNNKIKILYCLNDLANGGIEKFCINVNKYIDKDRFSIDYCLVIGNNEFYNNKIAKFGGNIFNLKNNHIFQSMIKILKENGPYSVIHIHHCKGISLILLAAYICKVPVRIVHSHNAFIPKVESFILNIKIKIVDKVRKIFINTLSTNKLGCSKAACKSMYGNSCFEDSRSKVIFNGIELNKFNKDDYKFKNMKEKYNINDNKINFINIGRFSTQKNQKFLLDILKELKELNNNIHLTMIGYGELEKEIKHYINKLKLNEYVTIMPHNTNIPEVLSVMDYFILPSLYEGLGIVFIEAQAMEIPCFASNYVPKESQLGLCNYIKLEEGAKHWAKEINNYINNNVKQFLDLNKLEKYKIENVTRELENIYSSKSV